MGRCGQDGRRFAADAGRKNPALVGAPRAASGSGLPRPCVPSPPSGRRVSRRVARPAVAVGGAERSPADYAPPPPWHEALGPSAAAEPVDPGDRR